MPRLFVAIDLPDEVKAAALRLRADVPGARWVKPNQLHLTLAFLGEVEPERQSVITAALDAVKAAPVPLMLEGVGRFPAGRGPARVLWIGVRPSPPLTELHREVEQALGAVGFAPEGRPFSPHLTLARIKDPNPTPAVDAFLTRHRTLRIDAGTAREFILFSSLLRPEGPIYTRETAFALVSG